MCTDLDFNEMEPEHDDGGELWYDSSSKDSQPKDEASSSSYASPAKKVRKELPFEDKKKTVDYWKSGKNGRLH